MSLIASRSRDRLFRTSKGNGYRARAEVVLLVVLVSLGVLGATALTVFGTPYDLSAAGLVATLTGLPGARLVTLLRSS